jgi:hypothetical protein
MCSQLAIATAINALLYHGFNTPAKPEALPTHYSGELMLASLDLESETEGCGPLEMPGPLTGADVRDSEWMKVKNCLYNSLDLGS